MSKRLFYLLFVVQPLPHFLCRGPTWYDLVPPVPWSLSAGISFSPCPSRACPWDILQSFAGFAAERAGSKCQHFGCTRSGCCSSAQGRCGWRVFQISSQAPQPDVKKAKHMQHSRTCHLLKQKPAMEHIFGVLCSLFAMKINFCQKDNGMES